MLKKMTIIQIFTDIHKSVVLNLKTLKNNWRLILLIIFIIFCGPMLAVIYVPYQSSGGWINFSSVCLPILTLLGWLTYTFRKSTIFLVYSLYGGNKIVFYLSQIILVFILANCFSIFNFLILFCFGKLGLFVKRFPFEDGGSGNWKFGTNIFVNWSVAVFALYITNLSALLSFSFYYLLHNFITRLKNYYIIIMIVLVLAVIFGGTLNSHFNWPDWLPGTHTSYMRYKYATHDNVLFPNNMFWVALIIMPFYGVGQLCTVAITEPVRSYGHTWQHTGIPPIFYLGINKYLYHWTLTMAQPFIWIILSFFVGTLKTFIEKYFK